MGSEPSHIRTAMNVSTLSPPAPVATPESGAPDVRSVPVPWHVLAVLFASASVVVGVLWDISWHSSIGRDTLFSPPHLLMYLGGVVSGLACGWHVLRTTFGGEPGERAASVTYWRYFRGPLGAWMCIWGAFAMLTSAPFDDWWHNAYGLDVKILAIQLGAMFMTLALQNQEREAVGRVEARRERNYRLMFGLASGLVLLNFAIMITEYTFRVQQHSSLFYQIAAGVFVLPLVAVAVAGRARWPATVAALTYTGVLLSLHFLLPLFPAEPKLAPVLFPLDRFVPPQFPLLLVVPAMAIDFVIRRWNGARTRGRLGSWPLAAALSVTFVVTFAAVQWPFADFLVSDHAKNWVFKQHLRPYMVGEDTLLARGIFYDPASGLALSTGLALAIALGVLTARIGLATGRWMSGVRR